MVDRNIEPPILPGCTVLSPMKPDRPIRKPPPDNAKRKPKRTAAGRFVILNNWVDFTAGRLSRSEILVWLLLYRDIRDGTARTSQTDLARRSGLSVSTVKRAIHRLEKRGLLRIIFRGGLRKGPSRYQVEPLEEAAAKGS